LSAITTHVLDTALGRPAAGVPIQLLHQTDGATDVLASERTDDDGRVSALGPDTLQAGTYVVEFDTATYFSATGQTGFFPKVSVVFTVTDPAEHFHVPLLLSPFAYSTYRGS
jgi:5-hydroxyisourate hydrolase